MKPKLPSIYKIAWEEKHLRIEHEAYRVKDRFLSFYLFDPAFPDLTQAGEFKKGLHDLLYMPHLLKQNPMTYVMSYDSMGGQGWRPFIATPREYTISVIGVDTGVGHRATISRIGDADTGDN